MQIIEKLNELTKERNEWLAKQDVIFHAKAHEAFKEVFDMYPTLEEFSWTQYAPYFNDGDECIFSVYADEPLMKFKGMAERTGTDDYYFQRYDSVAREFIENTDEDKATIKAVFRNDQELVKEVEDLITKMVYSIPEEVLKDMFGEGEVVVGINGIEVEDCEHD